MTTSQWTPADLPELSGVTAVVTGANSGLGWHTALELARRGARVVLGCRDTVRGEEALGQLRVQLPGSAAELRRLDLSSLDSVREFAEQVRAAHPRLGLLVNNAGVMGTPRRLTADGFELQLGTNHLGHFALTGLLLPSLLAAGSATGGGTVAGGPARVVTVSSALHRRGRLHRADLMLEQGYTPYKGYGQSKLANLLFTAELARRAERAGAPLASLAAHPGYAATNLQGVGPRMTGNATMERVYRLGNRIMAQSAAQGAWPSLRAAGDPAATSGQYYGPTGIGEWRGHPGPVGRAAHAQDLDDAAWLWQRSAELTGVDYSVL